MLDLENLHALIFQDFSQKIVEFPQLSQRCRSRECSGTEGGKKNPLTTSVLAGAGLLFLDQGKWAKLAFFTPFDPDCSMIITKLCKNQFELRLENEISLNSSVHKQNT